MTDPATVEKVARALALKEHGIVMRHMFMLPLDQWTAGDRGRYANRAFVALAAHEAAIKDAGMVVIPREPTEAMINDEGTWAYQTAEDAAGVYRAMIAAYEALPALPESETK